MRHQESASLSALAQSFEKPPWHESKEEEEASAQAQVQKKQDEAEVQVNFLLTEATEAETREARGQGRWYKFLACMPTN